ncbi:MAG: hypothetical protein B6V02_02255 [Thermoprotei archaeon ex4572_64]|nr:MAG: hypothetical protein B6V02_02255 [Thermoprotei archaeon ex4572_64]
MSTVPLSYRLNRVRISILILIALVLISSVIFGYSINLSDKSMRQIGKSLEKRFSEQITLSRALIQTCSSVIVLSIPLMGIPLSSYHLILYGIYTKVSMLLGMGTYHYLIHGVILSILLALPNTDGILLLCSFIKYLREKDREIKSTLRGLVMTCARLYIFTLLFALIIVSLIVIIQVVGI